jgi:hypothetical protein
MLTLRFTAVLWCLTVGCTSPDPRHGTLEYSDLRLATSVAAATALWSQATYGDVRWKVGGCESGDSCARITVKQDLATDEPLNGLTVQELGGAEPDWANIWINDDVASDPSVLAHELGHFLLLDHTAHEGELMSLHGASCIRAETLAEYEAQWGIRGREACL